MSIQALREKRARAVEQARAVLTAVEGEGRTMNEDESRQWDGFMGEADALRSQIERMERLDAEERALSESQGRRTTITRTTGSGDSQLRSYLLGEFNPGQAGLHFELRAQSVGTASAGGYTVADEPMTALETALKQFGGMRNVARVIRTSTGADLPMPLLDDTANVASIVGENTTLGTASLTFGQTTFKAWKYSTGIVLVPFELLQDSSVNVGEVVGGALGTRIARGTNADFTSGNGTTAPQGIVTAANVGLTSTTLGNVTYDEIVTLIHSVDAAYRQNGVFMLHDQTLAAIRKLKDDGGRPLFWSDAQSLASGIEGTILGYKYVVNNDMPALATASAKSILFGDFNAGYAIRDVQDVQILRLAERYADVGQVAFVGLSRHDGRVIDAGTHPVQAFKNKAS